MSEFGKAPAVREWLVELILWRREQDEGLSELPVTEWMAAMLRDEAGAEVRAIDGVRLRVVPESDNSGVRRGLSRS